VNKLKKIAILMSVVVLILAACSNEEAAYETVDISEVTQYQEQGALVIDVRETNEYVAGHIPGAMNKPLSELSAGNLEGLDPNQKYVVVCQSGNRSKQASDFLVEKGYEVVNVKQGMSSWTGAVEN